MDIWLAERGWSRGYVLPLGQCWELAQAWYTGRGERDWQRPDAAAVFARLGLTGDFWRV